MIAFAIQLLRNTDTHASELFGPVRRMTWLVAAYAMFAGLTSSLVGFADEPISAEDTEFFESKIRPILVERCYECHSLEKGKAEGKMTLDSRDGVRTGGLRGSLINTDEPTSSLLLRAIEYNDPDLQMPPQGKLPDEVIALLRAWVEKRAPDPRSASPEQTPEAMARVKPGKVDEEKVRQHWAYHQPVAPELPTIRDRSWSRRPWDQFILSKLEAKGLQPSHEADRRTLIRRLYYDLIGIPPTAEQIETFAHDSREQAYEKLVDELLASNHFGERMARRWMDVVRYSDTKGYVFKEEREYPHAYRYRDWLIKSFNSDLAYNDFVRYQLAADRLDPDNAQGHLDAMGMLTLGRRFLNNQNDIADDRIDVVTRGLMAMSVGCARCHDHKYDPIRMADYYSLHGVFVNSHEPGGDPSPLRLVDQPQQKPSFILLRGQPGNRGDKIERQFVRFLNTAEPKPLNNGSGRIDLADAIVDPTNPLTARVYVNRIWGWVFGAPLVDSPSDFGMRCDAPIQQDVLDWLTIQFVQNGWSTKKLVRELVMSATYRQTSIHRSEAAAIDPENRLWWRTLTRRMDFESYRDALLAASGLLDGTIGGPSVAIHEPPFSNRRTLYAQIERQNLPGLFRTFDMASPDVHVPQRVVTTVPQQGLFALNSPMMIHLSDEVGKRAAELHTMLTRSHSKTQADRETIEFLFRRILARLPKEREVKLALEYLSHGRGELPLSPENAWQYGFGRFHLDTGLVDSFARLPRYDQKRWIGKSGLPDKELGWVMVNTEGGHPGGDHEHASIRRWTAPRAGMIRIRGNIEHKEEEGDGIEAALVVGERELIGRWKVRRGSQNLELEPIEIREGEVVDFAVDCVENENHDSYIWKASIRYVDQEAPIFRSHIDFSGLQRTLPTAWSLMAQALMTTNEFCFID